MGNTYGWRLDFDLFFRGGGGVSKSRFTTSSNGMGFAFPPGVRSDRFFMTEEYNGTQYQGVTV